MREKGAGFLLAMRGTLGRAALTVVGTSIVEAAVFAIRLEVNVRRGWLIAPETLFDRLGYGIPWFLGLLALCVVLACGTGRCGGYTVRRLAAPRWMVLGGYALYVLLCLFVFWAFQLLTAFLLCRLFLFRMADLSPAPMAVFLAFYRSEILHHLLPLADGSRWFATVCLYLGAALCITRDAAAQWDGRPLRGSTIVPLWAYLSLGAVGSIGLGVIVGVVLLAAGGLLLGQEIWEEAI